MSNFISSENQLWQIIIELLNNGFLANNETIKVKQGYQANNKQYANKENTIYIHKLNTEPLGSPKINREYDEQQGLFVVDEIQKYLTTYQITTDIQESNNIQDKTALDIANLTFQILNSRQTVENLVNSNIGISKINQIRKNYNIDDSDHYRNNCNFDFVLNYQMKYTYTIDKFDDFEIDHIQGV